MANLVYKRVSTDQQSTARQNFVLDEAGIEDPVVFEEEAGTSSRLHPLQRPKFAELLTYAQPGDVVHVSEMFRLVRGTGHIPATRRPRPRDAAGVAGTRVARGLRPGGGGTLRLAPDSLAGLRPPPRPTEPLTAASLIPAERDVVDVGAGANRSATTTFSLVNGASSSIGRRAKRFTVSRAPFRGC
ncbi:recombinase family protein [Streptomyces sp. x-80]|uniref:recombinase family protein n=1 Tax=Streptomyces sp. x-80 TaxID=2789282 RepID=UPI0039804374